MKILLIELWGLGDGVLMTGALRASLEAEHDVSVLCQPATRELLSSSFPKVSWISYVMPWTPFKRKYHLWIWPWKTLLQLIQELRAERFDMILSARPDPREHLFMFLAGGKRRISLGHSLGNAFLTQSVDESNPPKRRYAEWNAVMRLAGFEQSQQPWLDSGAVVQKLPGKAGSEARPLVALHIGAGHSIRRWKYAYWIELLEQLRVELAFSLILITQPGDGESDASRPKADAVFSNLDLKELQAVLAQADAVLCNDSGPAHIAEALGTPTFAVFGAGSHHRFGPWRNDSKFARLDYCPHHPCKDRCHFKEPICLTELTPAMVFRQAKPWLDAVLKSSSGEASKP